MVAAGVALLAEGGWAALTARAIARRSGANTGLIHYHFGGLPGLRREVARSAAQEVVAPFVGALAGDDDPAAVLDRLAELIPAAAADEAAVRLMVELIAGAGRDPELCQALRGDLREARAQIAARIARLRPDWPAGRCRGAAVLAAAQIDGLVLHAVLDPDLPVEEAAETLRALLTRRR
ncbi:TetR/AcrR family transcriptional regulator [Streptomonospora nanhaiensis]|uniref:AcrR family transcriptional regulator n=1 Tax=Streptomonospora nanhaiensis TaxID=1323731 RepID=A0A853BHA3_9ACTN|nr:TetR/AcrR family transcriptional regulator [Streptomonospora nanhaiensis]NYI94114.1 AcrR family transcriptional regulator [Streptomonospora nanhaiensis]